MIFRYIVHFLRHLVTSIFQHNLGMLAAVIAFFAFSSMIPLLLLIIYGASILIPRTPVEHFLLNSFKEYVPTIPDSRILLSQNVSRLAALGPRIGLLGVIGLLWTAIGGFVSFQQILDVIWEAPHKRSFVSRYLVGFGMLALLLILTVVFSLVTAVSPELFHRMLGSGDTSQWVFLAHDISRGLFPLLLFITCYFCYRFLPSLVLDNLYLLIGAFVSTLAIYGTRQIFVWYTGHLGRYEMIYGALTFIMLLVFWLYIVSGIVLFGGECAVSLQYVASRRSEQHTP